MDGQQTVVVPPDAVSGDTPGALPFDFPMQIAVRLSPADLLNLIHTPRSLREILMSKANSAIWSASRQALGIPDGPKDLSEPLFAHFVLGETTKNFVDDGEKVSLRCNFSNLNAVLFYFFS